ncbi:MAG: class I SAM-dependent methyltransferase [Caldimonas sp.]
MTSYRETESEQKRIADVLRLTPAGGKRALDVGARDGYLSKLLAEHVETVSALDLEEPRISHPRVVCVKGDATELAFDDDSFDLVVCTEVLEHIPPELLEKACSELARVSKKHVLVGVPYKQDIRVGRATCTSCGTINPPWGHVNAFDEPRLRALFNGLIVEETSFVGENRASTNFVSAYLLDMAGNPYGTYDQEEPCITCGEQLRDPPSRTLVQLALSKLGFWAAKATEPFHPVHPYWIHLLLRKQ